MISVGLKYLKDIFITLFINLSFQTFLINEFLHVNNKRTIENNKVHVDKAKDWPSPATDSLGETRRLC